MWTRGGKFFQKTQGLNQLDHMIQMDYGGIRTPHCSVLVSYVTLRLTIRPSDHPVRLELDRTTPYCFM